MMFEIWALRIVAMFAIFCPSSWLDKDTDPQIFRLGGLVLLCTAMVLSAIRDKKS